MRKQLSNPKYLPVSKILFLKCCSFFIALLLHFGISAQIHPKKRDSLARAIDFSTNAYKAWQDSFTKKQDSIYRSSIKTNTEQNNHNPHPFLTEQKRREDKQRQQAYIRISIGVLFFMVLILGLLRKSKPKD